MFDNSERDKIAALAEMEKISRIRSNFDQVAARETFKSYLDADRRFDGYDKAALISRVQECRSCGASLDLTDPKLRGLPPRPLDRRYG